MTSTNFMGYVHLSPTIGKGDSLHRDMCHLLPTIGIRNSVHQGSIGIRNSAHQG